MKQIDPTQLINRLQASDAKEHQQQQHASGITKKVDSLFDHLADIYGGKFNLAFPDEESEYGAKKAYAEAINGVDGQTLGLGLKKLVSKRIQGEFKYLDIAEVLTFILNPLTDGDLGIPDSRTAYHEACLDKKEYSHEIVKEARRMTGIFELKSKSEKEMFPKFKEKYEHLRAKLMRGEEITPVSNAIEDQSNKEQVDTRTPEEKERARKKAAEQALNAMKGLIG